MKSDTREVDKFGFLTSKKAENKVDVLKENARIEKWEKMIGDWDKYTTKKFAKLKARIRKGIPNSLRGRVWCLLSEIDALRQNYPEDYYSHLLSLEIQKIVETEISVDLDRTFPNHVKFRTAEGKSALFRVLRAYAVMEPEVSYTQGMSFIVACFLLFVSEEEAFWMLVALITQHDFRGFFIQGMPKVYTCFYISNGLLRHYVPKVFRRFKQENLSISMYATQWFMTGFLTCLPIDLALRIWDSFWCEGLKIYFRSYLTLIKLHSQTFSKSGFEKIMETFRNLGHNIETEPTMTQIFKISLKSKLISRLERDYSKGPKLKYVDWVVVKH